MWGLTATPSPPGSPAAKHAIECLDLLGLYRDLVFGHFVEVLENSCQEDYEESSDRDPTSQGPAAFVSPLGVGSNPHCDSICSLVTNVSGIHRPVATIREFETRFMGQSRFCRDYCPSLNSTV